MELPYLGLLTRKPSLELYARFIMLLTIKQKNNNQLKLVICNLRLPPQRLTSAALVHLHTPTFWGPPMMAGVSLSMEIQYLHPVGLGSELIIDVQVLKCTPTLANLRCEVRNHNLIWRIADDWRAPFPFRASIPRRGTCVLKVLQ